LCRRNLQFGIIVTRDITLLGLPQCYKTFFRVIYIYGINIHIFTKEFTIKVLHGTYKQEIIKNVKLRECLGLVDCSQFLFKRNTIMHKQNNILKYSLLRQAKLVMLLVFLTVLTTVLF
jgi:hypothetical protein